MGGNATTGNSVTDGLSRIHRMTIDEAKLILNMKNATEAEKEELIKVSITQVLSCNYKLTLSSLLRITSISLLQMRHQHQVVKLEVEVVAFTFNPR